MTVATGLHVTPCTASLQIKDAKKQRSSRSSYCTQLIHSKHCLDNSTSLSLYPSIYHHPSFPYLCSHVHNCRRISSSLPFVVACVTSSDPSTSSMSTRLYVSGLSFRTTRESLQSAFQKFGQLVEVNLVMDKIAKRPRGFAFLRYETEEEAKTAIEGMHGKFLDGRVIFVEVAKPRSESDKNQQNSRYTRR